MKMTLSQQNHECGSYAPTGKVQKSSPSVFLEKESASGSVLNRVSLFILAVLFSFGIANAQVTSTAAGGPWNTGSTWVGGTVPGVGQNVVIATTGANTVDIAANPTFTPGLVTVNNGARLTSSGGTITFGSLTINNGGTVTINRSFTVNGATLVTGAISFGSTSTASRAIAFNGDVTLNAGASWTEATNGNNGDNNTYSFGGNFTNSATGFTATNNAAAIHTFNGANKIISGSTTTAIPYLTINGTTTNNGTVTVASVLAGSSTLTNSSTGTLNVSATSSITTLANAGIVNISGGASTGTAVANFTNTGTINISSTGTITGITNNAAGIVNHSGSSTITSFNNATATSTLNISTTPTVPSFGTLTATVVGNTVNYNGAGNQTIRSTGTYQNLTLGGSGTKTAGGALTINGNFTLGTGTMFAGAFVHNVGGNWINNGGTFTNTGSTINLNGAAQSIGGTSSTTFNDLDLTGSNTKTLSIATAISGDFSIAAGVLANLAGLTTHTSNTLTISGTGRSAGIWGSTTSGAPNQNAAFTGTGTINVAATVPVTYYSRAAGGNWNSPATWSTVGFGSATNTGSFPVAGDFVNIGGTGTRTVTVTAGAACATIDFDAGSNTNTISINSGITLDVSGAITIPRPTTLNAISVGAGTFNAGSIAFTGGGGAQRHTVSISTGTVTVSGNVTQASSTGSATFDFSGAGTLNLGGSFLTSTTGTLTLATGCTVNYNGAAQTVGNFSYNNLTLSGSGSKTTTGVTVNSVLSMEGTATASAAITYGGAATLQYNTATSRTVSSNEWLNIFAGTGGVIIKNTGVITLNVAKQFGTNTNVPLNINPGATLSTNNLGLTFHGDFINDGTLTAGSSAVTIAGTTATHNIDGFTTTGLVSLTKTGGIATLTGDVSGATLTINGAGGTLNLGAGLTHTFTGTWTRTNGTLNGGSSTLRLGAGFTGTGGTFTAGTGTVEWNGGAAQALALVNYHNLTLSGAGAKTTGAGLTIGGDLTMGSGTPFTAGAFTHNVSGDWINNGASLTTTGSTINMNGPAQNIGGTLSTSFNNLMLAGTSTKTLSSTVPTLVGGNLSIGAGVIADLGTLTTHTANSLTLGGVGEPSGTAGSTGSAATYKNDTYFAAASPGIVSVNTSTCVTGRWLGTVSTNWHVAGNWCNGIIPTATTDVVINTAVNQPVIGAAALAKSITLNTGASLTVTGANTLTVSGDWTNNGGTFTANTSTVTFNGAGSVGGTASTIFNNLTVASTVQTDALININGNLAVNSGTLSLGGFAFTVTGTTSVSGAVSTITAATGTKTFTGAVTINGGGSWNLSGQNPATSFGSGITNNSGSTFNNGTGAAAFTATQSLLGANAMTFGGTVTPAASTVLTNSNASTVTISSIVLNGDFTQGVGALLVLTASAPFSGTQNFNAAAVTNSVTYTGAGVAIKATTYSNLIINGSGTATVSGVTTVDGTMTVSSAVTNNNTLSITTALSGASILTQGASSILNIGGTSGITNLIANTASNTVNYTGVAQTVKLIVYRTLGLSGSGVKTMTGVTSILTDFNLSGTVSATPTVALTIGGTFTLGSGTTFSAATFTHNVAGNWVNNGATFNANTSAINFNGTVQSIGGTASTTFNNVNLSTNASTKTFSSVVPVVISGRLAIATGVVANLGTLTTHTANDLTLSGTVQSAGAWGSTSSAAVFTNNTFFSAVSGLITVANSTCIPGTWIGTTSTDWNTASNWCGGVPTALTNVVIPAGGNQPTIGAAGGLANDITISGTLIAGSNTLTVSGNWTNAGTFTANTSTVIFNGTAAQNIIASAGLLTFNNLTLATGTAPVNVNKNVTINGTLNFTSGNSRLVVLNSANNITFGTAATVANANSNSYIQLDGTSVATGNVIKTTPWVFDFPIGTATGGYTPVSLPTINTAPTGGSTLSVKAIYTPAGPSGQLLRAFRMVVAGNGNATTFTNGVFNYNNTTDIASGDVESDYTAVQRSVGVGAYAQLSVIPAPTNQFTVATSTLGNGTFRFTIGKPITTTVWYSYQSGVFSDWQVWTLDPSGTTLDNPLQIVPDNLDEITMLNGFTITYDVDNVVLNASTINPGGTLDMSTRTGHTLGTLTGTGVLRIKGTALPAATYTAFVSTAGGTIEYYNDATATFNLPASQVTYNSLKFTNETTGTATFVLLSNLTVNGTLDIGTSGAGNAAWQINDASNTQRTINITGNVNVGSLGRITVGTGNEAATTPHIVNLSGNFTNNGSVKFFDATDTEFSGVNQVNYGNTTIGGDVNAHTNELQGNAATVTFIGTTDNTITCNNTTDFYRFVLNKGTGQSAILTVNSSSTVNFRLFGPSNLLSIGTDPNEYSSNALSIQTGTLQLTGSIDIPILVLNSGGGNDFFSIPQVGALWLNGAGVTIRVANDVTSNDDQRLILNGLLRVTDGVLIGGNSSGIVSDNNGSYFQEGGTVHCWQFRPRGSGSGTFAFKMTGGTLNVGYGPFNPLDGGADNNGYARFDLDVTVSNGSSFQMTGGTLNVSRPTTNGASGISIGSALADISVTGGTVNVYNDNRVGTTGSNFIINSTAPFFNLNIYRDVTQTNTVQLQTNNLTVLNNLTLVDGTFDPTFIINNLNLTVGGNFDIQNGTIFTPGTAGTPNGTTGVLTFNGTGAQAWTQTGSINGTIPTLIMTKTAGTTLTLAGAGTLPNITNTLTLTSGILADGGKTINMTGTTINNSAVHSGAGAIVVSAATTLGGNNGTFGNLTLTTNSTITQSGNQTVSGNLRLASANTSLQINNNALTVLGNIYDAAAGTTATGFSSTKRIVTGGLYNSGGLTRGGSVAPAGDLLFPVGSLGVGANPPIAYTPLTINVTATTYGNITVRPVNNSHPVVTTPNQSLEYFWRVTSSGYAGISNVLHKNYTYSTAVEDNPTANYVPGRYDPFTFSWGYDSDSPFTPATAIPDFNTANTGWPYGADPVPSKLDGEYTAGNPSAFGAVSVFYSRQSGSWGDNNTWSNVPCTSPGVCGPAAPAGVTPGTSIPGTYNPIVIGDANNAHTVTIDVDSRDCGTLELNSTSGGVSSILDCSTFVGLNFGANTGGLVKGRGTLRVASASFPAGDFVNFIGATGGTVEWYGATTTIPILGPAPYNLSLANYYNLIVNPNAGQTITLPASNLTINNDLTVQSPGNGIVLTNGGGVARNISITRDLTISSGSFNFSNAATSPTALTVGRNTLNNGTWGVVAAGSTNTHTLSTAGGITNTGTITFSSANSVMNLTFTGSNNVSFNGTGIATTLRLVNVNKGTSQTPTVDFSVGGPVTAATSGWLSITNGTFHFNNGGSYTITTTTNYTIQSTARLKVSSGAVSIINFANNNGDLFLNGTLEVAGGTVNVTSATNGNDIEYASTGTPTIIVSGGALNVNGSIRRSTTNLTGVLTYNQTGGTVTVGGRASSNLRGVFEILNTGSSFTLTGASQLSIERGAVGGAAAYRDVLIIPAASNVSSTSTIALGLNGAASTFRINIAPALGYFIINGGGTAQTVNMFSNPMVLGGSLTITSPSVLNTNNFNVTLGGNMAVTGTYNGGTNTTTFNGTVNQSGTLTASSTFNNLTISNTGGSGNNTVSLSGTSPTLNNLNILSGILDIGTLVLNVNADVTNNSIIQTAPTGAIVFSGAALTHNVFSIGGTFTNLTIAGSGLSNEVKLNPFSTDNATILGVLVFTGANRYLTIGANLLTLGAASSISGAGTTAFIRTNGVESDLGVTKVWGAGAGQTFTYPIGTTTNYTPVAVTLDVISPGSLSVIPVNSKHLTVLSTQQILNYYWIISRESALVATASAPFTFNYPSALITGTGGSLVAGYLDLTAALLEWVTSGHGGSATSTLMTYTSTPTTNFPAAGDSYNYSVGTTATLPSPISPVYSRILDASVADLAVGGNWSSTSSWTFQSDGLGSPISSVPFGLPIEIMPGSRINVDVNGRNAFSTVNNGLLVTGTTVGHNLGIASGSGILRVSTTVLPAANYTAFVSVAGGTIEYTASASPLVMNTRTTYNHLSIFGSSGTVNMSTSDLTLNGNLSIQAGVTLNNASNANMDIAGTWTNNGGTYVPGSGTVTFTGPSASIAGSASTNFGNLAIAPGANLTAHPTTINVSRNFTNNGTFTHNDGTVNFNGTTQSISGTASINFKNVNISNTEGTVSLNSNANLNGTLLLPLATSRFDADGAGSGVLTVVSTSASSAAGIGIIATGATFTGNITVQRHMGTALPGANRYISMPVSERVLNVDLTELGLSSGGFIYNEAVAGVQNNGYKQTAKNYVFQSGRGFVTYNSPVSWDVRGPLTVGSSQGDVSFTSVISFTSTSGGITADGWNLVGNPYPHAINWNNTGDWTDSNIDPTIYVPDVGGGVFRTWNRSLGSGTPGSELPNGNIAIGQAFWIKANAAAPTLTVKETAKRGTGGTFYRNTSDAPPALNIALSHGDVTDYSLLMMHQGATPNYDQGLDAFKLEGNLMGVSLISEDAMKLAHYVTNKFSEKDIPLHVMASEEGTFSLSFSSEFGAENFSKFALVDKYMNKVYPITSIKPYVFEINQNVSSRERRFYLSRNTDETTFMEPTVMLYPNPAADKINIEVAAEQDVDLVVYSTAGIRVMNAIIKSSSGMARGLIDVTELPTGIYLFKTMVDGRMMVNKVIRR